MKLNNKNEVPNYEVDAIKIENQVREQTGDPNRTTYSGQPISPEQMKR